jgi:hypothetical protein
MNFVSFHLNTYLFREIGKVTELCRDLVTQTVSGSDLAAPFRNCYRSIDGDWAMLACLLRESGQNLAAGLVVKNRKGMAATVSSFTSVSDSNGGNANFRAGPEDCRSCAFEASSNDHISALKSKSQHKWGCPPDQQPLSFRGGSFWAG